MEFGLVGQAAGMFAATNVDDIVLLALYFGQTRDRRGAARVVLGQYLGFAAILGVAVVGALGATLLPESAVPYLGLLPLLLGLRAARRAWRERHDGGEYAGPPASPGGPAAFAVAAVTLANGGDNIGVYVPVFATRPLVARTLSRWGHVLLPIVLIGLGLAILVEGGAFGLG